MNIDCKFDTTASLKSVVTGAIVLTFITFWKARAYTKAPPAIAAPTSYHSIVCLAHLRPVSPNIIVKPAASNDSASKVMIRGCAS